MINIKKILEEFNITNKEELANLFLYTYEYSFDFQEIFKTPEESIVIKDKFLHELSNISNLERLWYGLYLKFTLYCNKDVNTKLLDNSIQKTIMQLSIIDINFLRKQISKISKIANVNIIGLAERPIIVMRYSDNNIFIEMGKYEIDIISFIKEHDKLFTQKKSDKFNLLTEDNIASFRKKEEIFLEQWSMNFYDGIMMKILPKITGDLDTNFDKDNSKVLTDMIERMTESELNNLSVEKLNKMLNEATGANEEQVKKILDCMSNLDMENYVSEDVIENITNEFVETIVSNKKSQKELRDFFYPINTKIIQKLFFEI